MKSVEENIDSFSRAILSEARGEADQVLADAKTKADATRQQAHEQAERERKQILERAKQEADRIRGQKIAGAQLKARTMQLDSREKLLNKVYTSAFKELPAIQQWTDYEEIARSLLKEAIRQLNVSEVKIRADNRTMSLLTDQYVAELSGEMNVKINRGDALAKGIGVIVESVDGHVQYDNTLETRLQRMWNAQRAPVYHLLMGEQL